MQKLIKQTIYKWRDWQWQRQNKLALQSPENKAKQYYDNHYDEWPLDENVALYDMRDGQQLSDSPRAILLHWLNNKPKMQHIIVAESQYLTEIQATLAYLTLSDRSQIHVVIQFSDEHMHALLTAKYVVTNAMIFSDIFVKRSDQIFINTWHGTPLKKMGYAMPGGVMGSWNVLRNLMMTDYLVMPNAYTTTIFRRDYRLDNLYRGQLLNVGYPRNDVLVNGLKPMLEKKVRALVHSQQKVILYAPTWSGDATTLTSSYEEIQKYLVVLKQLQQQLPQYDIRFKAHPYVYQLVEKDKAFASYLVPNYLDTNYVLAITDILITDYSSLFFDYLITQRPILFLDQNADYQTSRGTYLADNQLPGPYTRQVEDIVDWIHHLSDIQIKFSVQYQNFYQRYVANDDGLATERVATVIQKQPAIQPVKTIRMLINGEDFSESQFDDGIVARIPQNVDQSFVIYERHLLDNWYGYQFFTHVDQVMPNSRIFVNKSPQDNSLSPEQAKIKGQRIVGNAHFDILVIGQTNASTHQKDIMMLANQVLMRANTKRSEWLLNIGYQRVWHHNTWELWQQQLTKIDQTLIEKVIGDT